MATVGNTLLTLTDLAKRTDPNGAASQIIQSLSQVNPILQDAHVMEGNLPTGHRFTQQTGLPLVSWRRYNEGVAASKSQTQQFDETCGMLYGLSKVDRALAKLNGNEAAYRANEDATFMQNLGIIAAQAIIYSSVVSNPNRIQGLTPRLNATSGNPAAAQIIKADANANGNDQTSIWLVGWGPKSVSLITPKGQGAGLQHNDLGAQLTRDVNGLEFTAWVTEWTWNLGLAVIDSRYLVRICNIDTGTNGTSGWKADLSSGADLVLSMEDAITAIYEYETVNPVFYMHRATFGMLQKQLIKKATLNAIQYLPGERFGRYRGIPIKFVDALTLTESVVS